MIDYVFLRSGMEFAGNPHGVTYRSGDFSVKSAKDSYAWLGNVHLPYRKFCIHKSSCNNTLGVL